MKTAAAMLLACSALAAVGRWCSPAAIAPSPDGRTLFVACATGARVEVFDAAAGKVARSLRVPGPATGLALSRDGSRLYVTCAAAASKVAVLDAASGRVTAAIAAGHSAHAPVLAPDGRTLFVCNRLGNDVSVIDTAQAREVARVKVAREPSAAAVTPDGRLLLVTNALPEGRADSGDVAAEIEVIDAPRRVAARRIRLPNGSTGVRGISVSPDGRVAAVTHLLARYQLPTTQVERGWMQTNAVSFIDVAARKIAGTVLLDELDHGAANPWAAAWTADGARLLVTHAGTHELSVIAAPQLLGKLAKTRGAAALEMTFLIGLRKRVALAGNGPRALAIAGGRAWVAGYFSDTLEAVDPAGAAAAPPVRLGSAPPTVARRGETLFNDGVMCFQSWQSCASCHGPDARVDGLNWDLLNDGIGNPKNVRSLLLSHRTPPAMSQFVRENAEAAVRAGIRHILFAERPEADAAAIDEWLKSLQPVPSPFLERGKPSAAARRGRRLFFDRQVGCGACHPAGLFTNLRPYDVGTRSPIDTVSEFDTPTLVEIWRTAPYLHDGSVATLREVLTTANPADRHGKTSHLTPAQIDDLLAYLLSL